VRKFHGFPIFFFTVIKVYVILFDGKGINIPYVALSREVEGRAR
jgi:hypothetical protein